MAKKGEDKRQKRLSAEKIRNLPRKGKKWTIKSIAGTYSKKSSVPLGFVIRDLLGLAKNLKETKFVLNSGAIKVNSVVRKDYRFAVGLFDLIDIEGKTQRFRVLLDKKGRLALKEVSPKEKATKLSKIVSKRIVKGGFIQIATNDALTIRNKKTALKVGDIIKIELPSKKIIESYELKKGNFAYVTGGAHVGRVAKIKDITKGGMNKPKLITLERKKESFQTIDENVFIVGEKKPDIELEEIG